MKHRLNEEAPRHIVCACGFEFQPYLDPWEAWLDHIAEVEDAKREAK
jgi:hypothetical protein